MNESIIRSPKWLRNFLDFEINTGEDIKGEPSKKMKKKIEEEERIKKEAEDKLRKEQEREEEQKQQSEFKSLFNLVIDYIYKHYDECTIDIPEKNILLIKAVDLRYKNTSFEFILLLDNTIKNPTFSVYILHGNKKHEYEISGISYTKLKLFIIDTVYEYHKNNKYNKKHKFTSSKEEQKSPDTKNDEIQFNEYFKSKYGVNVVDFNKKSLNTKENETEQITNKRRRYNLLKDTLIGYERELFKILNWEDGKYSETHPDKQRVENEIENIKNRIKVVNNSYKFENRIYNLKHLKRFNS